MAAAIASRLGIPHLELDSVFHQPNWAGLPTEEFVARVAEFTEQLAWVVDGNYTSHGITDVVWDRADTVVWLDLPRSEAMRRVVRRTLRRIRDREDLWNGNRERWTNLLDPRPEGNIILWTWTRFAEVGEKYGRRFADDRWAHVARIRLRTPAEVEAFVDSLPSG